LILNGEQRGFVWDDCRADHAGIAPVKNDNGEQMTFADWSLNWLEKGERGEGRIERPAFSGATSQSVSSGREFLILLLLVVVGLLLGIALQLRRR
jgi:hypothetical protein